MANNTVKPVGAPRNYSSDRGKSVTIDHPVVGIVKDNIDPTHSGRIRVYIANFGGIDPNDATNWVTVRYMTPYFGKSYNTNSTKTGTNAQYGSYVGNPVSYGFWASSPDIGTEVVCIFVDGRPEQGFYIGSPPEPGIHHMVPAIGSNNVVVPNNVEASSYGSAKFLPVSEVNIENTAIKNSTSIYSEPKPVHSYQASILNNQGLIRDTLRGVITSSSQRETPSRVIGISTPGGNIYSGGFTNKNVVDAAKSSDPSKLQIVGKTGGHSLVLDDGTINGQDQLVRLRTSGGHMIMMNDSGQNLFIIHSNGQSWIEMNKEGAIDIYSTNSFNVRTQGDINFHADRDININAGRNLNISAQTAKLESTQNFSIRSGANFYNYSGISYTVKSESYMSLQSSGTANFSSSADAYISANKINLNTGQGPEAQTVETMIKKEHDETVYSENVGWISSDIDKIQSIASRVPTHQPFVAANKGVDVKINPYPNSTSTSSGSVAAADNVTPPVPSTTISTDVPATVTNARSINIGDQTYIDASTVAATISQQSALVSNMSSETKKNIGIIDSVSGISTNQTVAAGIQKSGSESFVKELLAKGLSYEEAGRLLMTGVDGVKTPEDLLSDPQKQISAIGSSLSAATNDLIRSNAISEKASATSVNGLILSASTYGSANVTNIVKDPASAISSLSGGLNSAISSSGSTLPGLPDMMSAGKFAAGISDAVTKIGNPASALALAEKTIGSLKGGVPNVLGGSDARKEQTENEKLLNTIASNEARENALYENYINVSKEYKSDNSSENYNKLIEAQTQYQRIQLETVKLKNKLISSNTDISTTQTMKTLQTIGESIIGSDLKSEFNSIKDSATTGVNVIDKLKNTVGSKFDQLSNLSDTIGATSTGVQKAIAATDTIDKSKIISKTGLLLGDPLIPPPIFNESNADESPNDYLIRQNQILDNIKKLLSERELLRLKLVTTNENLSANGANIENTSKIDELNTELAEVETQLQLAQNEYESLVS
jgi:hypothetical protein